MNTNTTYTAHHMMAQGIHHSAAALQQRFSKKNSHHGSSLNTSSAGLMNQSNPGGFATLCHDHSHFRYIVTSVMMLLMMCVGVGNVWADATTIKTVDGTTTTWDFSLVTKDMCGALSSSNWEEGKDLTKDPNELYYKSKANGGDETPGFLGGLTINTCGSDKSRIYYSPTNGYCFNGGFAYMIIPVSEGQTLEIYSAQTIVSATSNVTLTGSNGVWSATIPSGVTSVTIKRSSGATYVTKIVTKTEAGQASDLAITSGASVSLAKDGTSQITYTTTSTGDVTFTSDNDEVATVSNEGLITAKAFGATKVTITQAADANYREGSATVNVLVPYEAKTDSASYTIGNYSYGFNASDNKTYYFINGFTVTNTAGKTYGYGGNLKNSVKYSANTEYTINIPDGITIEKVKLTAQGTNGSDKTAANWGTIFGTSYSDEVLPYSDGTAVTKEITLTSPQTGGTLSFTPGGNQVQMIIELIAATPKSSDATLSDLKVNGTTVTDFASATESYSVTLPYGTVAVPTVAATATDGDKATVEITQATSTTGTATVKVTAEDGVTTKTYTIAFSVKAATPTSATSFSIDDEIATRDANTPSGWTKVVLPTIPEITSSNIYNVTDATYGASTSSTDNAAAIQSAIDAAATAGGMVVIPAGTYLTGPITMKSNVVLHLCAGATLNALPYGNGTDGTTATPTGSYPTNGTNSNGKFNYKMLISCDADATNVVVEGEGETSIIDGQGAGWWPYVDYLGTRPPLIRFEKGSNFLFRNFKLQNAAGTNLTLGNSGNASNFTVHDVTISNPSSISSELESGQIVSHNTDGIPVWGPYVNIYNCNISTGDDNIVFDSNSQYGHVWNCTFGRGHGASIGSYTEKVHDIIYENITFDGTSEGFRIKTQRGRSGNAQSGTNSNGAVKDIICRNCTMTNVTEPIILTTHYDGEVADPSTVASADITYQTPEYCNITFQNITATNPGSAYEGWNHANPIYIYGLPELKIHDITFDNVKIASQAGKGVFLAYCENLNFINGCEITGSTAPVTKKYEVGTVTGSFTASDLAVVTGKETESISVGSTYTLNKGTDYKTSSDGAITYTSSDPTVATVDESTGVITAIADGTTTITISQAASLYAAKEVSIEVTVGEESTTEIKEKVLYTTTFQDWTDVTSSTTETTVAKTTTDSQSLYFYLMETQVDNDGTNTKFTSDCITSGYLMSAKTATPYIKTSALKSVTTVTFVNAATGTGRGWGLKVKGDGDTDWVTLSSAAADPYAGQSVTVDVNRTNVQLWFYNLNSSNNAYMTSLEIKGNVEVAKRTFKDFKVDFRVKSGDNKYTVVTPTSGTLPTGVSVTTTGWNGAQHGATGATMTVAVDGPVKFYIGGCGYTNKATVSIDGGTAIDIDTKTPGCEDAVSDIASATYTKYATYTYNNESSATLTFNLGSYCPYIIAEACDYIPPVTVTYYDANGTTVIGTETVDGGSALAFKYGASDVTVASGKTFRGWNYSSLTGKRAAAGDIVSADIKLYACVTTIETTNVGNSYTFDLTKSTFLMEDHDVISATGGSFHDATHGWSFKNCSVNVSVGGYAKITVKCCNQSNDANIIASDPDGAEITKFSGKSSTDGFDYVFYYTGTKEGNVSLTFGNTGTTYVHAISVEYVSEIPSQYTVTFKNGSETVSTATAYQGTAIGSLPDAPATTSGKQFIGWYTATDGTGLMAETSTVLTGNMTFYANIKDITETNGYIVVQNSGTSETANKLNGENLVAAILYANSASVKKIFVPNGTYDLGSRINTEITADGISLIGESMDKTIIKCTPNTESINTSAIKTTGDKVLVQDMTLQCYAQQIDGNERGVALWNRSKNSVLKNVYLKGTQDTYYTNYSEAGQKGYVSGGKIEGTVDFICGAGNHYFDGVSLFAANSTEHTKTKTTGDYLTAPNTYSGDTYGYVFKNAVIDGEATQDGTFYLARAWNNEPRCTYIGSTKKITPATALWTKMSSFGGTYHFEDLTEEGNYTINNVLGDWATTAQAAAAQVTADVDGDGSTITFNAAGTYLIEEAGAFVDIVTKAAGETYEISNMGTGTYTVRKANDRGGFGDKVVAIQGEDEEQDEDADAVTELEVKDEPFGYAAYFSRNKADEADRTVNVNGQNISKVTGGGVYTIEQAETVLGSTADNTSVTGNVTIDGNTRSVKAIRLVANTLTQDANGGMDKAILNAITNNDVIVFDGKGGDFVFYNYITLKALANKTLIGTNNARLATKWYMTSTVKAMLDQLNVKNASTLKGTGGDLKDADGNLIEHIDEAAEYLTRSVILDNVGNEDYRNSGIFNIVGCGNFVMRNLKFVGPGSCDAAGYDLTTLENSKYFWMDHCEYIDGLDGNLDIKRQSDFITVSWSKFYYTDRSYVHQNTNLIGHTEDEYKMKPYDFSTMTQGAEVSGHPDEGYLNITWAYNNWGDNCHERMPMVRYGKNHILNCYYSSTMQGTKAVDARLNSEVRLEHSSFVSSISKMFSTTDAKAYTVKANVGPSDQSLKYSTAIDGSKDVTMPYDKLPYVSSSNVATIIGKGAGANIGSSLTVVICDTLGTVEAHQKEGTTDWYLGDDTNADNKLNSDAEDYALLPLFVKGTQIKTKVGFMKLTGSNLSSGTYDIEQYLPGLVVEPAYITVSDDGKIYAQDANGNVTSTEGCIFRFAYTPDKDRDRSIYNINFVIGNKTATMPLSYGRASEQPTIVTDLKTAYNIVDGKSHTLTVETKEPTKCTYQWYAMNTEPNFSSTDLGSYKVADATSASYDYEYDATSPKQYVFCMITKNDVTVHSNVAKFTAVEKFNLIDFEGSYQAITAESLPEGVTMTGATKIDAISIDKGTTAFYAPKLSSNYWAPTKTTYTHNTITLSYCGGFREGDVIKVYGYINNNNPYSASNTGGKYGVAELFTRNPSAATSVDATRLVAWTLGDDTKGYSFVNMNSTDAGVAGNPNYPTDEMVKNSKPTTIAGNCVNYTLTAEDITNIQANGGDLYLGRLGNTSVSISKITITRGTSKTASLTTDKTSDLVYTAYSYSNKTQTRQLRLTGDALTPSTAVTISGIDTDSPFSVSPASGEVSTDASGNVEKVYTVTFDPTKATSATGSGSATITFAVGDKSTSITAKYTKPAKRTDLTQSVLSGKLTWDFANAANGTLPVQLTNESSSGYSTIGLTTPSMDETFNLAELPEIKNTDNFLANYLMFKGEYPLSSDGTYAVAKEISFQTAKSGSVEVKFCANASQDTYLFVNGKSTGSHSATTDASQLTTSIRYQISDATADDPKEVKLNAYLASDIENGALKTGAEAQSLRIYSISFIPDPEVAPTIDDDGDLKATYSVKYSATSGENGKVTLSLTASNVTTYEWYRSTTNATTGGTKIPDVTGATYTYSAQESDLNTPFYVYCVMTNVKGSTTSAVAKVSVTKKGTSMGNDYAIDFSDDGYWSVKDVGTTQTATINNHVVTIEGAKQKIEAATSPETPTYSAFDGYDEELADIRGEETFSRDWQTGGSKQTCTFAVDGPCTVTVYWYNKKDAARYLTLYDPSGALLGNTSKEDGPYFADQFEYTGTAGNLQFICSASVMVYYIDIKHAVVAATDEYKWDMKDWSDLFATGGSSDADKQKSSTERFPADGTSCDHNAKNSAGVEISPAQNLTFYGGKGSNNYMWQQAKTFSDGTSWTYKMAIGGKTYLEADGGNNPRNYFVYNAPYKGTITVYGYYPSTDSTAVCMRSGHPLNDTKATRLNNGKKTGDFIATYKIPATGPVYIWFPESKVDIYGIVANIETGTLPEAVAPTITCSTFDVSTKKYTLTLQSTLEDSRIIYTTDYTDPATSGNAVTIAKATTSPYLPSGTVTVDGETEIHAITVCDGYENSDVVTFTAPEAPAPQGTETASGEAFVSGVAEADKDYVDAAYTIPGSYVAGASSVGSEKTACLKLRVYGKSLQKIGSTIPKDGSSNNLNGITIKVNDGFVITKVEAVKAVSNDTRKYNITGVYADATNAASLGTNLLTNGSLTINDNLHDATSFTIVDNILAKDRLDLVFAEGDQMGTTSNHQANILLKVYYETDETPNKLTVKTKASAGAEETTTEYTSGTESWTSLTSSSGLSLGDCYNDPVITLTTDKGNTYTYNKTAGTNDGWTVTTDMSRSFTKTILGKAYTVKANITSVEAPVIKVDESQFSFTNKGYPVTITGNGTIMVRVDDTDGTGTYKAYTAGSTIYAVNKVESYAINAGTNTNTETSTYTLSDGKKFDPSKKFAAWVYQNDYASAAVSDHTDDKVYNAVKNVYNVIDLSCDKDVEILTARPDLNDADLVVVSEMVSGKWDKNTNDAAYKANYNQSTALVYTIMRDVLYNTNILNMKMFTYGASSDATQRWAWGLPLSYDNGNTTAAAPVNKMLKVLNGVSYDSDGLIPLWTADVESVEHIQPTHAFTGRGPTFTPLITVGTDSCHVLHYADLINDEGKSTTYAAFGINCNDYKHYGDNITTIVTNICQMISDGETLNSIITKVPDPVLADNGDGSAKITNSYNLATTYYKAYDEATAKADDFTVPTAAAIIAENKTVLNEVTDKFTADKVVFAVSICDGLDNSGVDSCTVKGNTTRSLTLSIDDADADASGRTISKTFTASSDKYTIPYNTSFRKTGYTVTAWKDSRTGTVYTPGTEVTKDQDLDLVAVWTANTHKLTDLSTQTEAQRTVTWNFLQSDGAPEIAVQWGSNRTAGQMKAFLVGQVHFSETDFMDVVLDIDASTKDALETPYTPYDVANNERQKTAKFNNTDATGGSCQVNNNTKFTFPAVYGMKVTYKGDEVKYDDAADGSHHVSKTCVSTSTLTEGTLSNPVYDGWDSTNETATYATGVTDAIAAERFTAGGIFNFTGETSTTATLTSCESAVETVTPKVGTATTRWDLGKGNGYMKYLSVTYPALHEIALDIYPEKSAIYDEAPVTVTYAKGKSNAAGKFTEGTDVTLTLTAAYGYKVADHADVYKTTGSSTTKESIAKTINNNGDGVSSVVHVSGETTVHIKMTPYTMFSYKTAVSPSLSGNVTISSGAQGNHEEDYTKYAQGKTITLTATPKLGYKFVKWIDPRNNNRDISLTDDNKSYYEGLGIAEIDGSTMELTVGTEYSGLKNNDVTYTAVFETGLPGTVNYDIKNPIFKDGDDEIVDSQDDKPYTTLKNNLVITGFPETLENYTAIVLPKYYTLYEEGYTLDHWICTSYMKAVTTTEGDKTTTTWTEYTEAEKGSLKLQNFAQQEYNVGSFYYFDNANDQITLRPVFVKNTTTFDYRSSGSDIQWDFRHNEYAQAINYSKGSSAAEITEGDIHYSTHATLNKGIPSKETKVDVPLLISGVFNTKSLEEWGLIGEGTDITIPSGKGAKFMLAASNPITETTIDGQVLVDWEKKTIDNATVYIYSYTTESPSTSVTLHVGKDYGYYKYLRAILPSADKVQLVAKVNNPAMGSLVVDKVLAYSTGNDLTDDKDFVTSVDNGDGSITYTVPLGSTVTLKTNRNHYYKVKGFTAADNLTNENPDTLFNAASTSDSFVRNDQTFSRTNLTDTESNVQKNYGVRRENQLLQFQVRKYQQTIEAQLDAYDTYQMTFSTGEDAEGEAPGVQIVEANETFQIPTNNRRLYYEGHTLMYWQDKEATGEEKSRYDFGEICTPGTKDSNGKDIPTRAITLTPVFEVNKFFLKDLTTEATATWYLAKDDGAPTLSYKKSSGILVTQLAKGDDKIDMKIDLNSPTTASYISNITTDKAGYVDSTNCDIESGAIVTVPTTGDCDVMLTPYAGMISLTKICGSTGYSSDVVRVEEHGETHDMNRYSYNYKGTNSVALATQKIEFAGDATTFHDIMVKYHKVDVKLPHIQSVTVGTGELPDAIVQDLITDGTLSPLTANMQNSDDMPQVSVTLSEDSQYDAGQVSVEQATVNDPVATIYLKTAGGQLVGVYEIPFNKVTPTIKPQIKVVQVDGNVAQQKTGEAATAAGVADGTWLVESSKPVGSSGLISVEFDRTMMATSFTNNGGLNIDDSEGGTTLAFAYWDAQDGTYTISIDKSSMKDAYNESNCPADDLVIKFTVKASAQVAKRKLIDFVVTDTEKYNVNSSNNSVETVAESKMVVASDELIANLKRRGIAHGTATEGIDAGNSRDLYTSIKDRYYIFVPEGEYQLGGNEDIKASEKVTSGVNASGTAVDITSKEFNNARTVVERNNISIIGEGRDKSILWNQPALSGQKITGTIHTFQGTNNFYAQDITFDNRFDYPSATKTSSSAHAVALWDQGKKTILKNVALRSYQSTFYGQYYNTSEMAPDTRVFMDSCLISGISDPVYGDGDIWFEKCTLELKDYTGVNIVNARQTSGEQWGFVFNNCTVTGENASAVKNNTNKWTLARPKENSPAVTYLHTTFQMSPTPDGYKQTASDNGTGLVLRMHEYDSWVLDENGNRKIADLSERSLRNSTPGAGSLSPVMTGDEASVYSIHAVLGGTDAYDPESLVQQIPAVTNGQVIDDVLQWDDNEQALCYFIYKANEETGTYKLIDITTDDTLHVESYGNDAWFKIRAANQRGGLGDFTEPIKSIVGETVSVTIKQVGKEAGYGWGTICLPWNAKLPDNDNLKVYAVTELTQNGNQMHLKQVTRLNKGQGYIIKAPANTNSDPYLFKEVKYGDESIVSILDGNPTAKSIDASNINCFVLNYKANYGIGFFKFTGTTLKPYSAWLTVSTMEKYGYDSSSTSPIPVSNGAKLQFVFDDELDAVSEVNAEVTDVDDKLYDLSGLRVTTPVKGRIYIKNGKKILYK